MRRCREVETGTLRKTDSEPSMYTYSKATVVINVLRLAYAHARIILA